MRKSFFSKILSILLFSFFSFVLFSCDQSPVTEIEKIYTCITCGKEYNDSSKAKLCYESHLPSPVTEIEKIYMCITCGKEYNDSSKAKLCYESHLPSPDLVSPKDVSALNAINLDGAVAITWKDPDDSDLFGIEVSWNPKKSSNRSISIENESILVSPGTQIIEIANLINGVEYSFVLKAMDKSGNKSGGKAVKITPSVIEKSGISINVDVSNFSKTNQNVILSVLIQSDNSCEVQEVKYSKGARDSEYFTDDGEIITSENNFYTIEIEENGIYSLYAKDAYGRIVVKQVAISNIDKEVPDSVSNFIASYNYSRKEVNLRWANPLIDDLSYCLINAWFGDEKIISDEKVYGTNKYTISNLFADNSKKIMISIVCVDETGNHSDASYVDFVPKVSAYVNDILVDKYHVSGVASEETRTLTVKTFISNIDLLDNNSFMCRLTTPSGMYINQKSCEIDRTDEVITSIISIPYNSSLSQDGDDYILSVILNGTEDLITKKINVCSGPSVYYEHDDHWERVFTGFSIKDSLDKSEESGSIQMFTNDIVDSSKVFVKIHGYNLDSSPLYLRYYDSDDNPTSEPYRIDVSSIAWTDKDEENTLESTVTTYIPYPSSEGIHYLKILDESNVIEGPKTTVHVYGKVKFNEFKIPVAGVYKKNNQVLATVCGVNYVTPLVDEENFSILCDDATITAGSKITIVNDERLTLWLTIPSESGKYPVTIRYGSEEITKIFDVRSDNYDIGDILIDDGTFIALEMAESYFDSDEKKSKIIGFMGGYDCYGKPILFGNCFSKWSVEFSNERNTMYKMTDIICTPSKYEQSASSLATFDGDIDGSDNTETIFKYDEDEYGKEYLLSSAHYLVGFEKLYPSMCDFPENFRDGWYVPSIAELNSIIPNYDILWPVIGNLSLTYEVSQIYVGEYNKDNASNFYLSLLSSSIVSSPTNEFQFPLGIELRSGTIVNSRSDYCRVICIKVLE